MKKIFMLVVLMVSVTTLATNETDTLIIEEPVTPVALEVQAEIKVEGIALTRTEWDYHAVGTIEMFFEKRESHSLTDAEVVFVTGNLDFHNPKDVISIELMPGWGYRYCIAKVKVVSGVTVEVFKIKLVSTKKGITRTPTQPLVITDIRLLQTGLWL